MIMVIPPKGSLSGMNFEFSLVSLFKRSLNSYLTVGTKVYKIQNPEIG